MEFESRLTRHVSFFAIIGATTLALVATATFAAQTVPTEIEQPGTQPGEAAAFATNCDSCHHGTDNPADEPSHGWYGSMMAHSARDPLFWATVAIAEQDFLPGTDPDERGGAGDLCLRCHAPNGWLNNRSTPTDGSALTGTDDRGVECEFCHLMVDPDSTVNIAGTTEEQNAPYEAFDPVTGEAYHGSGQWVLNSGGTRLGPYEEGDHAANHQALGSDFVRDGDFCGTCHDVSNPAVGDLAHNFGAQQPLAPGTYSGVLGAPVDDKAAFNNKPFQYGIVERTFSEWKASAFDTALVNDYPSLPAELQDPDGILDWAYHQAYDARGDANYVDGDLRYWTCQTCHMSAATGKGANKNNAPTRTDLPRHDMTGGGYWVPDAIQWQANNGTLRFGTLSPEAISGMNDGVTRATARLQAAATLEAAQEGSDLRVSITNLTGHKLISGYPEGRRMWINIRWLDGGGALISETGGYGPIGRSVNDNQGVSHPVESILDLESTVVIEAEMGLDKEWAAQLLSLGYDSNLALGYDRMTDAVHHTLGELAAEEAGHTEHSFHFVLNNRLLHDNRIPPYGMSYDEAVTRNIVPEPADQFGNPGPGGTYDHVGTWDFSIPGGAETAEVRLYYQQTSWEYVQFLWLANDGLNTFLGDEGQNLLDAWLNTGQSAPVQMETVTVPVSVSSAGVPGQASDPALPSEQMLATWNAGTGQIDVQFQPACDANDHTVYWGDLSQVSSYAWSGATCGLGIAGSASFDPGTGNVFFVVVGENGSNEGSYGADGGGAERPEASGVGACDRPQQPSGVVCE